MKNTDFRDKKIGILGFGIENQALLEWLVKHGAKNITICDQNSKIQDTRYKKFPISNFQFPNKSQISNNEFQIKYQLGENYLRNLEQFDIVFRTPGISYLMPEIQKAKKAGVNISSQIKLFMDLCSCKTIGVTGTKGKGTTSTLIYEILRNTLARQPQKDVRCSHAFLAGNIGNPPIEFLDKLTKDDIVILELSSFQLHDLEKSPNIAVVLDIKSDHLDYHKDEEEYIRAKENIVRYQSKNDSAVINLDYLTSFKFAALSPTDNDYYFSRKKSVDLGAYVEWTQIGPSTGLRAGKDAYFGKIILRTNEDEYEICKTYDVTLRGKHNLENICAAVTASYLAGADIGAIKKTVPKFKGLKHRLEFVGEVNGVKFYNDSFSTMPDTTIAAIKSFSEPIILVVGGSEKGADYTNLGREISKSSVKTLITIGTTGPKIIKTFKHLNNLTIKQLKIIQNCRNMREIINTAVSESNPGDVVLLSPASASFDMFKNYKDRGNQFKAAVAAI